MKKAKEDAECRVENSKSRYEREVEEDNPMERIARGMILGARGNVRSRYQQNLRRLGLSESYYDETMGICDLMLLNVGTWTKYQIVYYKKTGMLEWPRLMPKGIAEQLIHDRMLIDAYEKSTSSGR